MPLIRNQHRIYKVFWYRRWERVVEGGVGLRKSGGRGEQFGRHFSLYECPFSKEKNFEEKNYSNIQYVYIDMREKIEDVILLPS